MPDFTIKQNDTRPAIEIAITRNSTPVTLASTVTIPLTPSRILLRCKSETNPAHKITGTMTIASANGGVARYTWQTGDTANAEPHNMEVETLWSDGGIETFPEDGYLSLNIVAELD